MFTSNHHFIILSWSEHQQSTDSWPRRSLRPQKSSLSLLWTRSPERRRLTLLIFLTFSKPGQNWVKHYQSDVSRIFPWTRKRTRCAGRLPLLSSQRIVTRSGRIFSVRSPAFWIKVSPYILYSLGAGGEPSTKKNAVPTSGQSVKKNSSLLPPASASPLSDNSTQQGSPV